MTKSVRPNPRGNIDRDPAYSATVDDASLDGTGRSLDGDDVHPDVAREAYALYCERGYVDGHDFDDWIEAERRVRQRRDAADAGSAGPVS